MEIIEQIKPCFGEEERQAVYKYMDSGAWLTEHEKTREFERMLADYLGVRHCIVVTNGTVSLFIALAALGISYGDEVIVPDYTMIATANAVVLAGAKPVFVDICADDLCIDLNLIAQAITPRTKAIVVVDLNGRAPDMRRVANLAKIHDLHLVEDAAQALGSKHDGQYLGTFGCMGCFSFSPQKIISTGQGGCIVTNEDWLASRIRMIKNFGRLRLGEHHHEIMGWNFKFTDLQAVIGIEQLKKIERRVYHKKMIFGMYRMRLEDVEQVYFIKTDLKRTCPWYVDILVHYPGALRIYLAGKGIDSRRVYPAIHSQPAYALSGDYPISEAVSKHGLWLPSSFSVGAGTIEYICRVIKEFYRERKKQNDRSMDIARSVV